MKSLLSNKRYTFIFVIGLVAISIGAISIKVTSYQAGECVKGAQELTLKNSIKKYFL